MHNESRSLVLYYHALAALDWLGFQSISDHNWNRATITICRIMILVHFTRNTPDFSAHILHDEPLLLVEICNAQSDVSTNQRVRPMEY